MARGVQRMSCSGCGKFFVGLTIFEAHRTGGYGGPIAVSGKRTGFKPSERRCLTDEELREAGLVTERRSVHFIAAGKDVSEERDVWYDPVGREELRQRFRGQDEDVSENSEI